MDESFLNTRESEPVQDPLKDPELVKRALSDAKRVYEAVSSWYQEAAEDINS